MTLLRMVTTEGIEVYINPGQIVSLEDGGLVDGLETTHLETPNCGENEFFHIADSVANILAILREC